MRGPNSRSATATALIVMTSSVNFHRVRGFSASNGPRYVSGGNDQRARGSARRPARCGSAPCARSGAGGIAPPAGSRPRRPGRRPAPGRRQSPPSASAAAGGPRGHALARVRRPGQQQQGQPHLRQPQQHRPAQVHGDRAQQRGQRETAYARGRARQSCPLAPLALHADQQADAQRDGEWKWTLHVHVPAMTRCRRRRRDSHPRGGPAAIGYAGDSDGGVRTAIY